MEDNLKKLLTLVKEVCDDHRQYKKGFNVITTFVKPHREVELHSRFITWLLDPKNDSLGLETLPLELFLKHLNSQFKVSKEKNKTVVVPNASNWTEDRDMDILIKGLVNKNGEESAIIIENKIYAKDSDKGEENNGQLARYLLQVETGRRVENRHLDSDNDNYSCKNKNIELFYLTLDGHKPTITDFRPLPGAKEQIPEDARTVEIHEGKDYEGFRRITYLGNIEPWLNEIILSIYNDEKHSPTVELIQQYLDALHCVSPNVKLNQALFAKIEEKELYSKALRNLLEDKDYQKLVNLQPEQIEEKLTENKIDESLWATAIFLLKNHKHLYWHALAAFFDELMSALNENLKELGITEIVHSENLVEQISNIIHQRGDIKKEHPYIGFWYNGIWWTIQLNEISKRFMLGIDIDNNPNLDEARLENLKDNNEINNDNEDKKWWFIKTLEPIVNPWKFLDGDTFDLLNEKKRKIIAQQYAKFVKDELAKLN